MEEYTVEFTITVKVHADDAVEALEKAQRQANIGDAAIYIDGNWYC